MVYITETTGKATSDVYVFNESDCSLPIHYSKLTSKTAWAPQRLKQFLFEAFLPQGFPESVSDDYVEYQIWDTVQAFASSVSGAIAAEAVLKGFGVGNASASSLAATLTWLLKDGTGMVGRILFAWLKGSELDCNAKRWRLFADILNDCALCLEILAPAFPSMFPLIICVAGIAKSIVGVAGGATRAALTQHQARRNNLADVAAKDGSQETVVNLTALVCSLIIIPVVVGKSFIVWLLFSVLTFVHLYANYKAASSVVMETLNQERLRRLVLNFLENNCNNINISIKSVNSLEPLVFPSQYNTCPHLGARFCETITSPELYYLQLRRLKSRSYLMNVSIHDAYISFRTNISTYDMIRASFIFHVANFSLELRANHLQHKSGLAKIAQAIPSHFDSSTCAYSVDILETFADQHFDTFLKKIELLGWRSDYALLGIGEHRFFEEDGYLP